MELLPRPPFVNTESQALLYSNAISFTVATRFTSVILRFLSGVIFGQPPRSRTASILISGSGGLGLE